MVVGSIWMVEEGDDDPGMGPVQSVGVLTVCEGVASSNSED